MTVLTERAARKRFTLPDAGREFWKHPSPWVIGATLVVALIARPARSIVNQSDGTVIPVGSGLGSCLDKSGTFNASTNPAPGEGTSPARLNPVQDAATQPQTFAVPAVPAGQRQAV